MRVSVRKVFRFVLAHCASLTCDTGCTFFQGRGKTTLLSALKGQKLPPNLSTVGIVINEWQVQISSSSRFTLPRFLAQVCDGSQGTLCHYFLMLVNVISLYYLLACAVFARLCASGSEGAVPS